MKQFRLLFVVAVLSLFGMKVSAQELNEKTALSLYCDNNQAFCKSSVNGDNLHKNVKKRTSNQYPHQIGDTFIDNGITYSVISTNPMEVQVGTGEYGSNNISGAVEIPASVVGADGNSYVVTAIGNYAFYSSISPTSISIPNTVTTIGNLAFRGCSDITSFTIPGSVKTIKTEAFADCTGLTSITIPSSVEKIEVNAFQSCSGLETMVVEDGNIIYDSRDNCNAIIESKTNMLVFGCKNTIIPNTVKTIATRSFFGCSGLTSIIFPSSVEVIESHAFYQCTGLTSVTIPKSVKRIGGQNPFAYCQNLTSVFVEDGSTAFDTRDNCNAVINTNTNELIIATNNSVIPNTVTSIGDHAFYQFSNYTSIPIPNSVTAIKQSAFCGCSGLTEIEIPNSVKEIGVWAFQNCRGLTSLNIPNSVESIGSLAFSFLNLTSVTIGSGVTYIGSKAFGYTSRIIDLTSLILSPFAISNDVFSVYNTATLYVPANTKSVYQATDGWKEFINIVELDMIDPDEPSDKAKPYAVLSEDNTTLTFYYDDSKESRNGMDVGPFSFIITQNWQTYVNSGWYTQRESITTVVFDNSFADCTSVASTAFWFYGCNNLTIITGISNLHTQNVTNMSSMFYGCNTLTNLDVTGFDTHNVTNMSDMFYNCSNLTSLETTNFSTQNVTNMRDMFYNCSSLTSLDVTNFNTQNVTDMSGMFYNCSNLTSLDVTDFNTQKVTNMSSMFCNCSSLTSLDVTNFNTQKVTRMSSMFSGCSSLTNLNVTNFNTQNVTEMSGMFSGCSSLTSLDVTNFDTQNVTYMSYMFSGCSSLTSLDMTNFNTQKVASMENMFFNCNSLTSLDVTNFNTQIVTNMSGMFYNCSSLTNLDVTNFNTQNVTRMGSWLYGMFSGCSNLSSLDVTNFDTQKVTDMRNMFSRCSSLKSLDVTNFNTQNVTTMSSMFEGCNSLTSLDVTSFNIQNVTDMSYMFYNCSSLTSLDLTNFNTQNVTNMYNMFNGCRNLALVTMGENMSVVKSGAFNYCPKLTDVYCLAVTVPNADSDAFDNNHIKANTTLHVPAESISDYQATVPWSYFKNIVALHETKTDLVDGEIYENEYIVNNVDASYTRTFNNTNWQALYVPFAMSYEDWKDDFDVAEINNFHEYDDDEDGTVDRTVLEILYVKSGSTLPNTPYMIRAKQTGEKVIVLNNATLLPAKENSIDCSSVRTKYTFTGTYTGVSGDEMYGNGYYALAEGSLMRPSSASVSLGTFRWYLKAESRTGNYAAAARMISVRVLGDEEDAGTTGIADGFTVDSPAEYYNLEGVKVNQSEAKGIVIVRQADGSMRKVIKK